MKRLHVEATPLDGLLRVRRERLGDERGFFSRLFCAEELRESGWQVPVAQVNLTRTSVRGSVRGLHFQHPPHAEMKLVQCVRGEVLDVAVDMRRGSPTFLRWHAERLGAENGVGLLIPAGFAHGFQSLDDDVEMVYCHSTAYVEGAEGGVHAQDPRLAIEWPLAVAMLSPRDADLPPLAADYLGIEL